LATVSGRAPLASTLSAMKEIASSKLLLVTSVIVGVAIWAVFAVFEAQPWNSRYGLIGMVGLGVVFGFLGKGIAQLWQMDRHMNQVAATGLFGGNRVFRRPR